MPHTSSALRKASASLCEEIDNLRQERKTAVERRCYLQSRGNAEEANTVAQRIKCIDEEVEKLHRAAKDQLIRGTADTLTQQAALLQLANDDRVQNRTNMATKMEKHLAEMRQMLAIDQEFDCVANQTINVLDVSARRLDSGNASSSAGVAAGEASSSSTNIANEQKQADESQESTSHVTPEAVMLVDKASSAGVAAGEASSPSTSIAKEQKKGRSIVGDMPKLQQDV